MRRLYLQIYLAVVCILLLFGALASVGWMLSPGSPHEREVLHGLAGLLGDRLPDPDAPRAELEAALARLSGPLLSDLALYGPDRAPLAAVGGRLSPPEADWSESRLVRSGRGGLSAALRLPDGRWLVVEHRSPRSGGAHWLGLLTLLGLAAAVGAYPVVRRLTRRLERLQRRVEALGSGDLKARVTVEGHDEVAELARSFNAAADRIERLVAAQRSMFASASHELRSPLARMRVAIELLARDGRPELRDQVSRDIAELDALIGEILLASRLDAQAELEPKSEVDLLALVAEEGARLGAAVSGDAVHVRGDARLLRRLVRNLLENARRYGAGSPIEASVAAAGALGARLSVLDRGPGVPAEERERIFEPFYRLAGAREGSEGGVGLGLALVRQIARRHGGEARCLAREGGGTCFEVTLRAA